MMDVEDITLLSSTIEELDRIRHAMSTWVLPASMDTVILTLIRYYYISIGLPVDKWGKAVKCDDAELYEIRKTICKKFCGRCENSKSRSNKW